MERALKAILERGEPRDGRPPSLRLDEPRLEVLCDRGDLRVLEQELLPEAPIGLCDGLEHEHSGEGRLRQLPGADERALAAMEVLGPGIRHEWKPAWIRELFLVHADRKRLWAEGDPVPARPRFRVYRGIAGLDDLRRENGLAWTLDRAVAERFASCSLELGLSDPLVLEGRVLREDVIAYIDWRKESEMICSQVEIVGRHAVSAAVGSTAATTGLS